MVDFTEALFTVPKIDIEAAEKAAYERGYDAARKELEGYADERYWEGYDFGYEAGLESTYYD